MIKDKKIGFIGGGFMAEALINGLIASKNSCADNITVADIKRERLDYLRSTYKVKITEDNNSVAKDADILVIAVKPNDVIFAVDDIKDDIKEGAFVISIAAGIKITHIAQYVKGQIARAMPNTCAQVGEAVTAIALNPAVKEEGKQLAVSFFSSVGTAIVVSEDLMDAVTAVSGSGPGYIYLVIESMIAGGVEAGLSVENARALVLQTVKGSAELAIRTGDHPAKLKERVTSPRGTTAAGLHELEKNNVRSAFLDAVAAAYKRAKELG